MEDQTEVKKEKNVIERSVQNHLDTITALSKDIASLTELNTVLSGIEELDDISYVSIFGETKRYVGLHLQTDKKDSRLIHKIAQRMGISFEKLPDEYMEGALQAVGSTKDGKWEITIKNYLPQ